MRPSHLLFLAALLGLLVLASCSGLEGFVLSVDGEGNAVITPPKNPITIPLREK